MSYILVDKIIMTRSLQANRDSVAEAASDLNQKTNRAVSKKNLTPTFGHSLLIIIIIVAIQRPAKHQIRSRLAAPDCLLLSG